MTATAGSEFLINKIHAQNIAAETICPKKTGVAEEAQNLASSLGIPDASCLSSQLFVANEGAVENGDIPPSFCACKDQLQDNPLVDEAFKSRAEEMKKRIANETEKLAMKTLKERIYEIQEISLILDTKLRAGDSNVSEQTLYEVPECSPQRLWDSIKKLKELPSSDCPHLNGRIKMFSENKSGGEGSFDSVRDELVKLTEMVNKNKAAKDGELPLRTFYSLQNAKTVGDYDNRNLSQFFMDDRYMDDHFRDFDENKAVWDLRNSTGFNSSLHWSANSENLDSQTLEDAAIKESQELINSLRRYPLVNLLKKNEATKKELKTIYENGNMRVAMMYMGEVEYSEEEQDKIVGEMYDEVEGYMKKPETFTRALEIHNDNCKKVLKKESIKELFCSNLGADDETLRERVLPSVLTNVSPEDRVALSKASNELYCSDEKPKVSETLSNLHPTHSFRSNLQNIVHGESDDYATFSAEILPIIQKYAENKNLSRDEMRAEFVQFLLDKGTIVGGKQYSVDKEGPRYQEALEHARKLIAGEDSDAVGVYFDEGLANALANIANREDSDDVHEQETFSGLTNEAKDGDVGVISNYGLTATEEDINRARTINREIIAARTEGREVDQKIVSANQFQARDFNTRSKIGGNKVVADPVDPPSRRIRPPLRDPDPIDSAFDNLDVINPTETFNEEVYTQSVSPSGQRSPGNNQSFNGGTLNRQRDLRNRIAESEAAIDRIQSQINQSGSTEKLEEEMKSVRDQRNRLQTANDFEERLNDMRQRQRALSNATSGRSSSGSSSGYTAPGFGGGSSGGSSYMNPYTNSQGVERFPASDENRLATGNKKEDESSLGGGSSGDGRGPASVEGGSAVTGAVGVLSVAPIPGFEGQSVSDCAIPTLYYVLQCYLSEKVFKEWSYLDEFSSEEEVKEAQQNPRELVKNLGFEGKAFIVVTPFPKDGKGREQVLVTTYDYVPKMLEDVSKMNDESFRKELLSKILSERWNFLAMRDYAKDTRIIEEQLYVKGDFLGLAEERKLKPMISSTAGELYNNVAKMNLRIQSENKAKLVELRQKLSSRR